MARSGPVVHLTVMVITPHCRLNLGPTEALRAFLVQQVRWLSLEELSREPDLDPLLNLLTLPTRPKSELQASSRQIVASRPDLSTVVPLLMVQRFPECTEEQIMVIAGIPREEIRHTRAVQAWLAEGRQEGEAREAAKVILRQLTRRCVPLSEATTARIQTLPLEQLESLPEALLDFRGPNDLTAWLTSHS